MGLIASTATVDCKPLHQPVRMTVIDPISAFPRRSVNFYCRSVVLEAALRQTLSVIASTT